jgi:hypothetical protein
MYPVFFKLQMGEYVEIAYRAELDEAVQRVQALTSQLSWGKSGAGFGRQQRRHSIVTKFATDLLKNPYRGFYSLAARA